LWTAAVLVGAVIAAVEAASHHAADNFMANALKTWQPMRAPERPVPHEDF
jgi:hypothetical protein